MTEAKTANVVSMERAVSVQVIRSSGGFAVKAKPGQKDPAKGWDPAVNSETKSELLLNAIEFTEDNLGLHLHGALVDVDIDSDAPFLMDALDAFLPPCGHVWGRKSRPKTHRVYAVREGVFDPAAVPLLRRLKRIEEAKIELRGGHVSRGEYSLLPGSIHPSGELYEWDNIGKAKSSLSTVPIDALTDAVRLAGAIAVLGPYWVEGTRNDLVMAVAGFLHRISTIAENAEHESFHMDHDQSKRFVEVLLDLTEDDKEDRKARLTTFDRTWDKGEKGVPVTGATTIAEITGDEDIISKLYSLLTDNPEIAKLEEFVSRFVIWQGPGSVIDLDAVEKGSLRPLITSRQNFINSYGDRSIAFGDKRVQLATLLYTYPGTRKVAGMTFDPGEVRFVDDREGTKVNQWAGFEVPPHDSEVSDDDIRPFIDYVYNILASENEATNEWLLGWIAHILKEPNNRTGTALVLVGGQGAGKSFLGHRFLIPIIGHRHAASTNNVDAIVKDFNVTFESKLYVQCDEAMNNRQKSIAARLKSLVTDPYVKIEPKGVDAYMSPNHMRLMFTSNDIEDAIFLDSGASDRRYTVVQVSSRKMGESEYWEEMVAWSGDKTNLSKVHRWLIDHQYTRRTIERPLVTQAKTRMQFHSWDPIDRWLAGWIIRNHPLTDRHHMKWYDAIPKKHDGKTIDRATWPELVRLQPLVDDFEAYQRSMPAYLRSTADQWNVGLKMKEYGILKGKSKRFRVEEWDERRDANVVSRPRLYEIEPPEKIAFYLDTKYGTDWKSKVNNEHDVPERNPEKETRF